ncbi:hypothetical protein NON20_22825 [Synechocystis sp. B12]|nr:hypothetical protein NON20_22825 [Synechocystis sp. B12]
MPGGTPDGADKLYGEEGDDMILAEGGDDQIWGGLAMIGFSENMEMIKSGARTETIILTLVLDLIQLGEEMETIQ